MPCVSWLCITGAPALSLATPGTAGAPNWDELHKFMMKALCSQGNSAPSLGKQSRLQKAKLGRDPARNGEKGNNSIVIHLMETYPTNRTFRNENSLYLLLSRAMSTANFSRLQGDRARKQSLPLHRTGPQQVTQPWDGMGTLLIPSLSPRQRASHPGAAHCETHLTLLGESLLIKTMHMENNWSAQFSPRFCPPAFDWKRNNPWLKWELNT